MKKKLLKVWQIKFFRNYVVLFSSFLLLEVIFRLISNLSIISYVGLRIFLALNVLALFLSFILSFFARRVARVVIPFIVGIASIYGVAELGFKNFIGVYASVSASTQAEAVTSYIFDFIKSFNLSFYLMFIPLILIICYYILVDKKITYDLPRKKKSLSVAFRKGIQVGLILLVSLGFFGTLKLGFMQNNKQAVSSYELFLKPNNPSLVVNDFGFISFGLMDIREYFWPGKEITHDVLFDPSAISSNDENPDDVFQEQVSIDNAVWLKIIEEEKNTTKNSLNKYFIGQSSSYTNEYTGIFQGKNLVMIMVESGSDIMINEEYYPNIMKLYQNGWSFDNYYSPRNTCSTGNNEFSNLTGLYTIYNNCTANVYSNNTYFESLFNLFNESGYKTTSYHNHVDQYYSRAKIHKGLGGEEYYNVNRLGISYGSSYGDWASDEDLMEAYLKILDKNGSDEPFMSLITTVTSHSPYIDNYQYNNKYKDLFPKDLPQDVRGYMSKLKVVDNAIGILLDGLEERGLLDDTVIALFADHYPYAISKPNMSKALGYDVTSDNNAEKVPFVIYSKDLEKDNIYGYTSHVNTTPTIANLFNLDFDSRLYLGHDYFDENYEEIIIFDDGSWKNKDAYYDASANKAHYYTEKVYSDEEILEINEKISLKLKMSSLAIRNNYFAYLKDKLVSYETISDEIDDSDTQDD